MRLSSEGSSDRHTQRQRHTETHTQRHTQRGFGCIASCVSSPLCCFCSVALVFTRFDVRMVRSDTSAATSRQEVPGMACAVWTARSSVAVRGMQDAVAPQKGHVPMVQQAEGREARRVHQRVVPDCGLAQQGGGSSGAPAHTAKAEKGQPSSLHKRMHWRCPRIRVQHEEIAMKQAQPLGHKMDQARPDLVKLSSRARRRWKHCKKRRRPSSKRNRKWWRLKRTWTSAHAGSPVASDASSTTQRKLGQNAGKAIIEKMWNSDAGQPPDHLIQATQESRAILQTSSLILCQEGGVHWMPSRIPNTGTADGGLRSGTRFGPSMEATRARKATGERTPMTPPPEKTQTTEPWAAEQEGAQPSQVQRLSARAMQNPRDMELLALSQGACALIPALASS